MNNHDQSTGIILYGIPNCNTVKKARDWLDTHAIVHSFHNFKKDGVTPAMIESWLKDCNWEVLLNRKGTTWRALSEERKAAIIDASSASALMCESPSVIKRPVLTAPLTLTAQIADEKQSYVGFSDALYQQIFKIQP